MTSDNKTNMSPQATTGGSSTNTRNTPARNNYSAPHTPIASAKRPRASMDNKNNSNSNSNSSNIMMSPGSTKEKVSLPPSTPLIHEEEELDFDTTQLSPMHKPRPLVVNKQDQPNTLAAEEEETVRQVGTIFSPMLSLLHEEDDEEDHKEKSVDKPKKKGATKDTAKNTSSQNDDDGDDEDDDDDNVQVEELSDEDEDQDDVLVEDDVSSHGSLEEDEFNPYVFIKSLPPYDIVAPLRPPIGLPPKGKESPPISLVLDLDETLVHCTVEPVEDADLVFPVVFHGMTYQVHVRLRPHLFTFLERIHKKFEVIVFTASQKVYADELLNRIDPDGKYIQHRMFRESCLAVEGNFLKDLNVLGRDLSKSVLVDNSPHAFGYQVDNGIPIESWFDDPKDTELLKLERFLRTLHPAKDVRSVIRKTFQTYKLIQDA